jgi:hypothetical protein
MTKRPVDIIIACSATETYRSLHQEGSGYVPANFEAEKVQILVTGHISVPSTVSVQDFKW